MKIGLYAMRDNLSGFLAPFTEVNDQVAMRNFKFTMARENTVYNYQPSDFSLYKLGEFDTESGQIDTYPLEVIA